MIKDVAKRLLKQTPYRISKGAPNRFQAIEECLQQLRRVGYLPRVIVDGGAHTGEFTRLAQRVFSEVETIHMVEPQPACLPALARLSDDRRVRLHACALAEEAGRLRLWTAGDTEPSTGVNVARDGEISSRTVEIEATTLDLVLAGNQASDRTLVKLDLQGFEPEALRGGRNVLSSVEVVLCEVSFFSQYGVQCALSVAKQLDDLGFDLFDIAALLSRFRDNRLKEGDFVFVRRGTPLLSDVGWS